MIFILLNVVKLTVFFILFAIFSYFFISGKNVKKTVISSVLSAVVFILVEILSPALLLCFLYLSEFFYNAVH